MMPGAVPPPDSALWISDRLANANAPARRGLDVHLPGPPPAHPYTAGGGTSGHQRADPSCTLFVGQLPAEIEEAALHALFTTHGTVSDVAVIRDKETRVGKGFAFVTLSAPHEAQAALHSLDGYMMAGRRLRVAPKV